MFVLTLALTLSDRLSVSESYIDFCMNKQNVQAFYYVHISTIFCIYFGKLMIVHPLIESSSCNELSYAFAWSHMTQC